MPPLFLLPLSLNKADAVACATTPRLLIPKSFASATEVKCSVSASSAVIVTFVIAQHRCADHAVASWNCHRLC